MENLVLMSFAVYSISPSDQAKKYCSLIITSFPDTLFYKTTAVHENSIVAVITSEIYRSIYRQSLSHWNS